MTSTEILATLKKLGKPQRAEIYRRQCPWDDVFGVLTSDVAKIAKKIKVDHALAKDLWNTGNIEARMLALQIADPAKLSRSAADKLVKDGPAHGVGAWLTELVARSPIADDAMRAWMKSKEDSFREMGYGILAKRLRDDPDSVSDADAARILVTIEKEIQGSPNWGRYAMNSALIGIGVWKPKLRAQALEAAKRIGKVEVDHGDSYCKTPEAVPYILKAAKRGR